MGHRDSVKEGEKSRSPQGFDPRTVQPAESLFRLIYTSALVAIVGEMTPSLNTPMIAKGKSNSWIVTAAVDTAICAPDDGWRDRPKHVEQFTDTINSV